MKIYHCTTEKKAQLYHKTNGIFPPVRGFDTLLGAMAWAIKTKRNVIYEVTVKSAYKLPDHHNQWGTAFWSEDAISLDKIKCIISPKKA